MNCKLVQCLINKVTLRVSEFMLIRSMVGVFEMLLLQSFNQKPVLSLQVHKLMSLMYTCTLFIMSSASTNSMFL